MHVVLDTEFRWQHAVTNIILHVYRYYHYGVKSVAALCNQYCSSTLIHWIKSFDDAGYEIPQLVKTNVAKQLLTRYVTCSGTIMPKPNILNE